MLTLTQITQKLNTLWRKFICLCKRVETLEGSSASLFFDNLAAFPDEGTESTIYIASDTGYEYQWNGSTYILLNGNPYVDISEELDGSNNVIGFNLIHQDLTEDQILFPTGGTIPTLQQVTEAGATTDQEVSFNETAHFSGLTFSLDGSPNNPQTRSERTDTANLSPNQWGLFVDANGVRRVYALDEFTNLFSAPLRLPISNSTSTGASLTPLLQEVWICDATSSNQTFTLPAAATMTGLKFTFKKIDVSANTVTITPDGSEKIDGAANYIISSLYESITIISDGSNWYIISKV